MQEMLDRTQSLCKGRTGILVLQTASQVENEGCSWLAWLPQHHHHTSLEMARNKTGGFLRSPVEAAAQPGKGLAPKPQCGPRTSRTVQPEAHPEASSPS